jgi:hypothetical protein
MLFASFTYLGIYISNNIVSHQGSNTIPLTMLVVDIDLTNLIHMFS